MVKKRGVNVLVGVSALLASVSSVAAQSFRPRSFESFLTGPNGILRRMETYLQNPYIQYFGMLFVIGLTITMIVKGVLKKIQVVEEEKFQNVIAIIIGFGTSNGIFFAFRAASPTQATQALWGSALTVVMVVGLIAIPIAFWVMDTGFKKHLEAWLEEREREAQARRTQQQNQQQGGNP